MRRLFCFLLCLSLIPLPAQAAEQPKYVALTFDDGPSGRITAKLLDGLASRDVKATFLLCGYRLKTFPRIAQRIHEEGHEIGLHGYSHKDMSKMDRQEVEQELQSTLALLPEGCKVRFLRPPGGAAGEETADAAKNLDLSVLLWSVDPRDWATKDAGAVEAAVLESVRSGDVVLLHDMKESSVDAALNIIDSLTEQGFRFVTASELARLQGVTLRPGNLYRHFR